MCILGVCVRAPQFCFSAQHCPPPGLLCFVGNERPRKLEKKVPTFFMLGGEASPRPSSRLGLLLVPTLPQPCSFSALPISGGSCQLPHFGDHPKVTRQPEPVKFCHEFQLSWFGLQSCCNVLNKNRCFKNKPDNSGYV